MEEPKPSFAKQFRAVLRKNIRLQSRHPCLTCFEFVFPALLSIVIALIFRYSVLENFDDFGVITEYWNYSSSSFWLSPLFSTCYSSETSSSSVCPVLYSPDDPVARQFVERLVRREYPTENLSLYGVSDPLRNENLFWDYQTNRAFKVDVTNTRNITVYLSTSTSPIQPVPPESLLDYYVGSNETETYYGVLPTIFALFRERLIDLNLSLITPTIDFQLIGGVNYEGIGSGAAPVVALVVSITQALCALPLMVSMSMSLANEKNSRVKEYMLMMGLHKGIYWIGWIVTFLLPIVFCVLVGFLSMDLIHLYALDKAKIFFLYLFFYLSIIPISFLTASLVKSFLPTLIIAAIWILGPSIVAPMVGFSSVGAGFMCLLPSFSMTVGIGKGIERTLAPGSLALWGDNYDWGLLLGMLAFDCVLFLFIAWYLSELFPGEYGVPKPWYFPFTKSFWSCCCHSKADSGDIDMSLMEELVDSKDSNDFEPLDHNVESGVRVEKLDKLFSSFGNRSHATHAVNSVSAEFKKDYITALLGHNGAGKTTLINMLVGMIPPSSGDAYVDGKSIVTDMDRIRLSIGICPQHDLLFPDLTAPEHLLFFGRLKGYSDAALKQMIPNFLNAMSLPEHEHGNKKSSQFSGGMKRKLSLAIAMFGNPHVVFLDEPTTGVDALSRRIIWDCLRSQKKDKTVILTTHSMEEADALSDYVYIMSTGTLRCGGSSMFLKEHFGVGHYVRIERNPSISVEGLERTIHSTVPNAAIKNESEASSSGILNVVVPFTENASLANLFDVLEKNGNELGVTSFGVSLTTLEDVFVKMTDDPALLKGHKDNDGGADAKGGASDAVVDVDSGVGSGKYKSAGCFSQFFTSLKMNILSHQRSILSIIVTLLIPVVLTIVLCCLGTRYSPPSSSSVNQNPIEEKETYTAEPTEFLTYDFSEYSDTLPFIIDPSAQHPEEARRIISMIEKTTSLKGVEFQSVEEIRDKVKVSRDFAGGIIFNDVALDSGTFHITAVINDTNHGSFGSLMQTFFNGVLMAKANDDKKCNAENCPVHLSLQQFQRVTVGTSTGRDVGNFIGPILIFLVVSLMLLVIATMYCVKFIAIRESMLMTQLVVCGMRPIVVYLANLLVLFVGLAVPSALVLVLMAIIDPAVLHGAILEAYATFLCVCVVSFTPLAYLFSLMFKRSGLASKLLFFLFLLLTLVPLGVRFLAIINAPQVSGSELSASALAARVMSISPTSIFGEQFVLLYIYAAFGLSQFVTYDSLMEKSMTDGGVQIVVTLCSGLVYFIIGAICDYFRYFRRRSKVIRMAAEGEDDDVKRARDIAESAQSGDFSILLKNVRKTFKKKVAVKNVSLAFPHSSCFALLGPNGAGKSTLVNMLIGELQPDQGSVDIMGTSMSGQKANVFRRADMSLCMQNDTVLRTLTPRQHLMLLHRTRCNCTHSEAKADVQEALEGIGVAKYADQTIGTLSGGNCRKLSVAVTMLPKTRVMVFDEPSTGMDPVTRRLMWKAIDSHKSGRCLLLTTHSMEEAEAVSDCIGIIAHGELQCIGSVQHLRDKFNKNYHLSIDLKPEAQFDSTAELIKSIVGDQSPPMNGIPVANPPAAGSLSGAGWSLVESMGSRRTYELTSVPSMGELFRRMELNKEQFFIQSYSLAQASLEDIFLQLVRREEMQINPVFVTSQVQKDPQPSYVPAPAMANPTGMPYAAPPQANVASVPYQGSAAPADVGAAPTISTTTTTTTVVPSAPEEKAVPSDSASVSISSASAPASETASESSEEDA